jgi:hypothetical protein
VRITHAIAAAALTAGLVAGAPAAQAAPVETPAAHSWHAPSPQVAKKAAKAKTRITASGPAQVKAGDDIAITAKLTHKSGSTYKAYAKQKLAIVVLDAPGADIGKIIYTKKTNKQGNVTFHLSTDAEIAGQSFDFLVAYQGGSKAKAAESDVLTIAVTE